MYTVTFILLGIPRVYTITTPHRATACIIAGALDMAGFKARVWKANRLLGV